MNAGVSPELDELRDIAARRARSHRRNRDARARAHRHPVAEGAVQQRLRLLHRDHARAPRVRAGATTGGSRRSPTRSGSSPRSWVSRADRPQRRRAPRRARAGDLHGAARGASPPRSEHLLMLAGRVAGADTLAALAEVAHRNGYCRPEVDDGGVDRPRATAAIPWSSGWPPPGASSPTTSASIRPRSRSCSSAAPTWPASRR